MPDTQTDAAAHAAASVTIRDLIAVVPDEVPDDALTSARALRTHFDADGVTSPRFFTRHVAPWQRRHLVDLRKGRPAYCAGGPLRLLDLDGTRQGAGLGAAIRHQTWTHVVKGTRPATPWAVFWHKHLQQPSRYPLDKAKLQFDSQPRVLAMNTHNAAHPGIRLDPTELEMFQAGPAGYANYCALRAICGDTVVTCDKHRLAPTSEHMADRVTYLAQAHHHLQSLHPGQRLLAIRL